MKRRLLCVWLPNWPVQRAQAAEPLLANQPLILSQRDPRRGLVVAAANLSARQQQIRVHMRLSEATALVDAEVREHDPQEDIESLCNLAERAQGFSPIVGLEQLDKSTWAGRTLHQPESLLLDITGLAELFGGEAKLANQVGQWLSDQQYFGCLGIAGSIGAAWAVANHALRNVATPPSKTSADDAGDQAAPPPVPACRIKIVPAGGDNVVLSDLPMSALRLPVETVQSLQRLGIQRIGQLESLPRSGMATRLGDQLITRWDQALDRKEEALVTLHSLPDWSIEQEVEYPTQNRETITELVRRASHELAQRLAQHGAGALRIVCRLDLVKSQPILLQLGLFRPTNDAQHLEFLLVGQLEQHLKSLAQPLWRLSLQATLTSRLTWRQADLFDGGETANRNEFARLVDILSARLGRKQVLSASTKRDAQPELAYTLQPVTGRRKDGGQQDTVKKLSTRVARRRAEPTPDDPLRRPTHVLQTPIQVTVRMPCAMTADKMAMAPQAIQYQGQWHSVTAACGPERLESGWWRGPSARRDYYRVETQTGSIWWIYRDLNSEQWFVHGHFD